MNDVGAEDLDERIEVVAYEHRWPRDAEESADQLRAALGDLAEDVQHIGSTAVPGLAAKPIIDLAVAVATGRQDQAADTLGRLGCVDFGEAGVPGRRYLRRRQPPPAINVHLMEPGGALWIDNVVLRDYLRSHAEAAAGYGAAKESAVSQHATLLAYSAAKAELIHDLLTAAREWAEEGTTPTRSR